MNEMSKYAQKFDLHGAKLHSHNEEAHVHSYVNMNLSVVVVVDACAASGSGDAVANGNESWKESYSLIVNMDVIGNERCEKYVNGSGRARLVHREIAVEVAVVAGSGDPGLDVVVP